MPKHKKPGPSPNEQSKLFIEKAREIGCEDGGDGADIMRRLAGQERQPAPTKKPPAKKQR